MKIRGVLTAIVCMMLLTTGKVIPGSVDSAGTASGPILRMGSPLHSAEPIVIVLHADMTSGSARAGEAIRRGATIAIAEINERGGLLGGRKLRLVVVDHHGVPTRGAEQFKEISQEKNLVAVLGGLHSPCIMQNLETIHQQRVITLVPWAAATGVVQNGYQPNYVFRVSAEDRAVGDFLVEKALAAGHSRLGILLERTAWGRSNEKGFRLALARRGKVPARVEWFHWGDTDMTTQVAALEQAGADAILIAANAPEGAALVRTLAKLPSEKRLPVFSHWGITGGDFVRLIGDDLPKVRLQVVQTYSFLDATRPQAREFLRRYHSLFGTASPREVFAPVGTAHAYDAVQLLAKAIARAGTTDRPRVRDALERLAPHAGLVRDYHPPFTPDRHEAFDRTVYRLATFASDGAIVPSREK